MNAHDIELALVTIVQDEIKECEDKILNVDAANKTERKALAIEKEMYRLFLRAGLNYNPPSDREAVWQDQAGFLKDFFSRNLSFTELGEIYRSLDEEKRHSIVPFMRGMVFMKSQFLDLYESGLQQAKECNNEEDAFELTIKVGAIRKILMLWQAWWNENGFIPCEVM